ncbi:MAG: hypothetical protein AAGA03_10605 [Planctomycetota bacterium]
MNIARVYFFRDGNELNHHPANGSPFHSFGLPTGMLGAAMCFEFVNVKNEAGNDRLISQQDFGGPVSIKVWRPDQPPQWFGLANEATVEKAAASRLV